MSARFHTTYHVRCPADEIEARARGIAVEQSVEMPLPPSRMPRVLAEIVGQVAGIADLGDGVYEVRIALAIETVGEDAGQMLNMILGNTSMHACVSLVDVEIPAVFAGDFRRAAARAGGVARARRRRAAAADRHRHQAAGRAGGGAGRSGATGWRWAGSITSRTTTATPTRRSRHSPQRVPANAEAVRRAAGRRPGIRPATCPC